MSEIHPTEYGLLVKARASCGPDEKVIVDRGMIKIVPKKSIDYLMDRAGEILRRGRG